MFRLCSNLQKIIFGNINTSSVENMQSLFSCCYKLTSINLSNFDTSNVKNMGYMFYSCNNLNYLDLSNFNTSKVETIDNLFYQCNSLIYLNMYSFKLKTSVSKTGVFSGISSYVKYCINDEETELLLFANQKKSNCSDICFKTNITVDINNKKCIDSCSKNEK